jgi:hypothetical protein
LFIKEIKSAVLVLFRLCKFCLDCVLVEMCAIQSYSKAYSLGL